MAVLITDTRDRTPVERDRLRKAAQALLDEMGAQDGELSILITDDEGITAINRDYFGRPWPTNVISFSMMDGEFADVNPEAKMLGDVVISADTAASEAKEAGLPAEERFLQLLVHGLLHIFGYDHEAPESDAALMETKSDQLMAMLRREGLVS